jgi:RHS repeat-associated protein
MDGYSYDSAGNLLYDNVHHYFYDAENRVMQVDGTLPYCTSNGASGSAATSCYYYDAEGHRVHRTGIDENPCNNDGNGGSGDFAYDLDGNWAVRTNSTGGACASEIYLGGRHFGTSAGNIDFDHTDWLGTSRLRNTTSTITSGYEACTSLPFGDGLLCNSTYGSNIHFTGKEHDYETGLEYFGARYDASSMGRFMSSDNPKYADRTDPQTWNLYSYVNNNPLSKTDPDGHNWFDINGQWSWHQGDSYTYKGADGKDVTAKSSYQYLLTFQKTGTNKEGATTGTLTLYGNDQGKAVASAQVFSGGNGNGAIPNGEYMMRLDIRGSATTMADMKANGQELKQFYGIQDISGGIRDANGDLLNNRWEWGSIRISLNHANNGDDAFQGNYLHGKERPGDYTHGCICNRSENVLREIRNLNPASVPRIPVEVK